MEVASITPVSEIILNRTTVLTGEDGTRTIHTGNIMSHTFGTQPVVVLILRITPLKIITQPVGNYNE